MVQNFKYIITMFWETHFNKCQNINSDKLKLVEDINLLWIK